MSKNSILAIFSVSLLMAAAEPAMSEDKVVTVSPGSLLESLEGVSLSPSMNLKLCGSADIRDFVCLRDMASQPGTLDLSELDISEYCYPVASYVGRSLFVGKALPAYIFFQSPYSDVILPEGVTVLEDGAFAGASLRRIAIPEGVTSIGEYAFYGCEDLEEVIFPTTLRSIGRGAFSGCPLLSVVDLSETKVTMLPDRVFADDVSLRDISLPVGLTSVGSEAFLNTAVEELVLPNVTSFSAYALAGMPSLTKVTLNENATFSEGTLMNDASLEKIYGSPSSLPSLFAANCYNVIPSEVMSQSGSVGSHAFANSSVGELVLASSVRSIESGAFSGMTNLATVEARGLGAEMPSVATDAFGTLDTSGILLMVDSGCEEAWRQHPVWGSFNVQSDQTVSVESIGLEDPQYSISARVSGVNLVIDASSTVKAGVIYSADGRRLCLVASGAPHTETSLENIEDNVLVVTVVTEEGRKTFKVMK